MKILELINLIQEDRSKAFNYADENQAILLQEIKEIDGNKKYSVLIKLFSPDNFFKVLDDLHLAFQPNTQNVFLGKLWSEYLKSLDASSKINLLNNLHTSKRDLWDIIRILPHFFEFFIPFDDNFLSSWLLAFVEYVKNDMANGVFYDAVFYYTKYHPSSALNILHVYLGTPSNENIKTITPLLLGELRKIIPDKVRQIDDKLKVSKNIDIKEIYYNSFIYSLDDNITEIDNLLTKIFKEKSTNLSETAYYIAYRIFCKNNDNKDLKAHLNKWFIKSSSKEKTPQAQLWCVKFIAHLTFDKNIDEDCIKKIILNLGPIAKSHWGIWQELEHILARLVLSQNFKEILIDVINKNRDDFLELLEKMPYFTQEFIRSQNVELFSYLFFSPKKYEREFIHILFSDELNFEISLDQNIILKSKELIFEIVFKEIMLYCHSGKKLGLFFSLINKKLDTIENESLKSYISAQIIYQSINYPKDCYEQVKNLEDKSTFLSITIKQIEYYFKVMEQNKNSPVNSFSFAGSLEAAVIAENKEQQKIRNQSNEKSVFAKFCKSTLLLYGDKHAHRTASGLTDSQDYAHFNIPYEIPILSFINVCQDRLNRLVLIQDITKLQERIKNG